MAYGDVPPKSAYDEAVCGLVCSDRWSAYHLIPVERRQLCRAHLRRDFQAMIDRGGEAAEVGEELLAHADMMFGLWHKVRDGTPYEPAANPPSRVADTRWRCCWTRSRLRITISIASKKSLPVVHARRPYLRLSTWAPDTGAASTIPFDQ